MLIQEPTDGLACDIPTIWVQIDILGPFYLHNSSKAWQFLSAPILLYVLTKRKQLGVQPTDQNWQ